MKGMKWCGRVTGDVDRELKGDVDRMILEGCASKMGCVYPGANGGRSGTSGADMGAEDTEASNALTTDCDRNRNCAARGVFKESSTAQHAALNEKTLAQIAAIMRDEALAPALKQRYTQAIRDGARSAGTSQEFEAEAPQPAPDIDFSKLRRDSRGLAMWPSQHSSVSKHSHDVVDSTNRSRKSNPKKNHSHRQEMHALKVNTSGGLMDSSDESSSEDSGDSSVNSQENRANGTRADKMS